MRVIAGEARGRKIVAPEGLATRPISDRAKESIFNMLASLGGFANAEIVDLYAGSGSFGIECLSRGAGAVTFVENGATAVQTLQQNLETLGFADRATIVRRSVDSALMSLPKAAVAFCDPPYADDPWPTLFGELRSDLLVAHTEQELVIDGPWIDLKRRKYGRAHILIAERTSPN